MPAPPFSVPEPIIDWIRNVFEEVNRRSAATLSRIPTTWETTLDHSLIGHLAEFAAPFRFASDWVVNLDTHYLGGGRLWGSWEIADIGFLVIFRQSGRILGTKLALMQSKRLYPDELEVPADIHTMDYRVGFGRLLTSEGEYRSQVRPRAFHFAPESKYRALEYDGDQYNAVLNYTVKHGIPVHYQLYNPLDLPSTANLPATPNGLEDANELRVGCRVINAATLDVKLKAASLARLHNPSFAHVAGSETTIDADFWTLHNFVADLVIGCKEGYIAGINPMEDEGLYRVFNLRSGPISAAISIGIDAPG